MRQSAQEAAFVVLVLVWPSFHAHAQSENITRHTPDSPHKSQEDWGFAFDVVRASLSSLVRCSPTLDMTRTFLKGVAGEFTLSRSFLMFDGHRIMLLDTATRVSERQAEQHHHFDLEFSESNTWNSDHSATGIMRRHSQRAHLEHRSLEYRLGKHFGNSLDLFCDQMINVELRSREHALREIARNDDNFDQRVVMIRIRDALADAMIAASWLLASSDPDREIKVRLLMTDEDIETMSPRLGDRVPPQINLPAVSGAASNQEAHATTVSSEALARTPVWKRSDANPPVSARQAIQLANEVRRALVEDVDDWRWHLASVALTPDDPENTSRWFWLVTYGAYSGGMSGPPHELHVVVLMDGTVLKPEPIQLPGRIQFGAAGKEQNMDNEDN